MTGKYQKLTDKELDNVSGGFVISLFIAGLRFGKRFKGVVRKGVDDLNAGKEVRPFGMLWDLVKPGIINKFHKHHR